MNGRLAVVFVVDGLRASALGTYGNTLHETAKLDALAAESTVVEWMWAESPELAAYYAAAWKDSGLLQRLADAGGRSSLVTDASDVAAWGDAAAFGDVWRVATGGDVEAADLSETALARVASVAADRLAALAGDASARPCILWIHSRGFFGPWDAPRKLRAELVDEGDPPPLDFVTPPASIAVDDLDLLLGYRTAYAAQVMVLDQCVGALTAAVAELGPEEQPLLVVTGRRGFALGEHGAVGCDVRSLYSELLHVPCLLRAPHGPPAPPRKTGLALSRDLHATLVHWLGLQDDGDTGLNLLAVGPGRPGIMVETSAGERALRTTAWMLRLPARGDGEFASPGCELYVKPDDRWEANEVSARCPEVAERLLSALESGEIASLASDLTRPAR